MANSNACFHYVPTPKSGQRSMIGSGTIRAELEHSSPHPIAVEFA